MVIKQIINQTGSLCTSKQELRSWFEANAQFPSITPAAHLNNKIELCVCVSVCQCVSVSVCVGRYVRIIEKSQKDRNFVLSG